MSSGQTGTRPRSQVSAQSHSSRRTRTRTARHRSHRLGPPFRRIDVILGPPPRPRPLVSHGPPLSPGPTPTASRVRSLWHRNTRAQIVGATPGREACQAYGIARNKYFLNKVVLQHWAFQSMSTEESSSHRDPRTLMTNSETRSFLRLHLREG